MMQRFVRGDHVEAGPHPNWPDLRDKAKRAIVIGSYKDQFGGSNTKSYTLLFENEGKVSWFPEEILTFIEHVGEPRIKEWEQAIEDRRARQSDLEWIVKEWQNIREAPPGASLDALMKLIGINNPWGSHGEGFVWYANAQATLTVLDPILSRGVTVEELRRECSLLRDSK